MEDLPRLETPTGDRTSDDMVLPFRTGRSGITGRLVRLGAVADTILKRHDYPAAISETLGEALALTAMLGSALKIDGKLIVQTKTDGILDLLVVNFESPGRLRAYASFDKERLERMAPDRGVDQGQLLGSGHLAMTIDPGDDMNRYQGIVALSGEPLTQAALTYFRQSEQLPTFIRLAVARHYAAASSEAGDGGGWRWRAGGILLQHLTQEGGKPRREAKSPEEEGWIAGEDDDNWQRARLLAATVEDHELLDPTLLPERLLYRLFHEEGVRAAWPRRMAAHCRCSRERVERFLRRFRAAELPDLHEDDGSITVTCEFCSTKYRFAPGELA